MCARKSWGLSTLDHLCLCLFLHPSSAFSLRLKSRSTLGPKAKHTDSRANIRTFDACAQTHTHTYTLLHTHTATQGSMTRIPRIINQNPPSPPQRSLEQPRLIKGGNRGLARLLSHGNVNGERARWLAKQIGASPWLGGGIDRQGVS